MVFDGIYKRLEREHHVTERDVAAAGDQADEAILARDQTQVGGASMHSMGERHLCRSMLPPRLLTRV